VIRSPTPLLNTKLKELPKNTTKRDLTENPALLGWNVELAHRPAGGGKSGMVMVRLYSQEPPVLEPLTRVIPKRLTARYYAFEGRSGVSFSADSLDPVGTAGKSPAAEATASKGRE
jgi:hypothetical protein